MKEIKQAKYEVSQDVVKLFEDLAYLQNSNYLSFDLNQDDEFKEALARNIKLYHAKILDKGLDPNDRMVVEAHEAAAANVTLEEEGRRRSQLGMRCPYELNEINNTLSMFSSLYDIKDPRAFAIIRIVISHQLSAFRMDRYSQTHGPVIRSMDKAGNVIHTLNPSEKSKLDFNSSVIDAISKLDQIFEGTKIQADIKSEVTVKDFLDKIIDVDKTNVKDANTDNI